MLIRFQAADGGIVWKALMLYSNEQIFVWDIDALREIVRNPAPPNLLDASGRLRRLLIDNSNGGVLLHKVAKGRDFTAKFRVPGRDAQEARRKVDELEGLVAHINNPSVALRDSLMTTVGLDDFLRTHVHYIQRSNVTVKDLINYVANVGGGVHQGSPRNSGNAKIIQASANQFTINGKPYPLVSIGHIATITIDALLPLYLRIRA